MGQKSKFHPVCWYKCQISPPFIGSKFKNHPYLSGQNSKFTPFYWVKLQKLPLLLGQKFVNVARFARNLFCASDRYTNLLGHPVVIMIVSPFLMVLSSMLFNTNLKSGLSGLMIVLLELDFADMMILDVLYFFILMLIISTCLNVGIFHLVFLRLSWSRYWRSVQVCKIPRTCSIRKDLKFRFNSFRITAR